jgi:hypothetical protein
LANVERLQMIQALVERMARNSFALKGFAVSVVGALLALGSKQGDRMVVVIALYVVVSLAGLDAYYLALERAYRRLYNEAVVEPDSEWGLSPGKVRWTDVVKALRSPSIFVLHGFGVAAAIVVLLAT